MQPTSASDNSAYSLLAALRETDPAAWCYLPIGDVEDVQCSTAFSSLWNLVDAHHRVGIPATLPRSAITQAFAMLGIDASRFFAMVSHAGRDETQPILLVRNDSLKLQATLTPVTRSNMVVGHLIRFREIVEANVIEAILREISEAERRLKVLSPREREILRHVYEGRTNKSVSISTGISEKTVEKHRARIMQKLGLNCAAGLFRLVGKAMMLTEILGTPDTRNSAESRGLGTPVGLQSQSTAG